MAGLRACYLILAQRLVYSRYLANSPSPELLEKLSRAAIKAIKLQASSTPNHMMNHHPKPIVPSFASTLFSIEALFRYWPRSAIYSLKQKFIHPDNVNLKKFRQMFSKLSFYFGSGID